MKSTFTDKSTTTLEDVRSRVGESLEISNLNQDATQTGYDQNHTATQIVNEIRPAQVDVDDELGDVDDADDVTIVNSG
jgi:hypothetical protein